MTLNVPEGNGNLIQGASMMSAATSGAGSIEAGTSSSTRPSS
jgi:hypothetical protein